MWHYLIALKKGCLLVLNKIENDLHELCINEQCNLRIISNANFRSIALDIMPEMGAARNC